LIDEDRQQRESLIRLETQLQDSIKNQNQILADLKDIFNKIEAESKSIMTVKSDLSNHLEMTVVRREDIDRRFKNNDEKLKELFDFQKNYSGQIASDIAKVRSDFQDDIKSIEKSRSEQTIEFSLFQKQMSTTVGLLKWLLGVLIAISGVAWPVISFFLKQK